VKHAHRDGERFVPRHITKEEVIPLKAGDAVRIASPGGGGWGNPLERDVEAVRKDVERELLGADEARTIYGVVLDRNEQGRLVVDADATSAERAGSDAR
jgi:N-methylhydantoinase B